MFAKFRLEPIVKFTTSKSKLDLVGYEVLANNPRSLRYGNHDWMLQHDLCALRMGNMVARKTGLHIHVNIEYTSLLLGGYRLSREMTDGLVIELVERLNYAEECHAATLRKIVNAMRSGGAKIAMDDVSMFDIEKQLIMLLQPDIIKVESRIRLSEVKAFQAQGFDIVAERIEKFEHALMAHNMGAEYLQGYWVNDMVKSQNPLEKGTSLRSRDKSADTYLCDLATIASTGFNTPTSQGVGQVIAP